MSIENEDRCGFCLGAGVFACNAVIQQLQAQLQAQAAPAPNPGLSAADIQGIGQAIAAALPQPQPQHVPPVTNALEKIKIELATISGRSDETEVDT